MPIFSTKSLFGIASVAAVVIAAAVALGGLGSAPARAEPWCHYTILSIDSDGQVDGADICENQQMLPPPHYAAIYYDDVTSAIGTSWGYSTEAAANQAALRSCRAYGGRNCQWATSGQNRCFALAKSSNGAWAPDFGNYPETATAKAISACQKNGGINCQVPAAGHPCSED
jgi:hypothetical protein